MKTGAPRHGAQAWSPLALGTQRSQERQEQQRRGPRWPHSEDSSTGAQPLPAARDVCRPRGVMAQQSWPTGVQVQAENERPRACPAAPSQTPERAGRRWMVQRVPGSPATAHPANRLRAPLGKRGAMTSGCFLSQPAASQRHLWKSHSQRAGGNRSSGQPSQARTPSLLPGSGMQGARGPSVPAGCPGISITPQRAAELTADLERKDRGRKPS